MTLMRLNTTLFNVAIMIRDKRMITGAITTAKRNAKSCRPSLRFQLPCDEVKHLVVTRLNLHEQPK